MNNWRIIANFILVALLQVTIFNAFLFGGYLNPYIYVLFLIMLPTRIPRAGILLISFAMGLSIDIFENSAGVHAAASTFLAYCRPLFFKILSNRMDDDRQTIIIKELSFLPLAAYSLVAIFLHHLVLFLIESFSFSEIGTVLARTVYSSLFTFIFVIIIHLWNYRSRRQQA